MADTQAATIDTASIEPASIQSASADSLDAYASTYRPWLRNLMLIPVGVALVHLGMTFFSMNDTRASAYTRLESQLTANKMTVLAPVKPGHQPLPFLGADARYAICRFDSRLGPVEVKAYLADAGWTLGIYDMGGTSTYFATTGPGKPTTVALTIVPAQDRFLGITQQALGKAVNGEAPESVSVKRGLIVVRAPEKGAAYRGDAELGLSKASCKQTTY